MAKKKADRINNVGNGAADLIAQGEPYNVYVTIQGSAPLLFHRWDCDAIDEKGRAAKGSKAKKTDAVDTYVYRNDKGNICLPGEYIRGAIIGAAKFKQDPRSPRKSAVDLVKAGIISMIELCDLGQKDWDYLDRRRVTIQRNAITRIRPAMHPGWRATAHIAVLIPEYISPELLNELISSAGRLIGVGDFRPTFGRFQVVEFKIKK